MIRISKVLQGLGVSGLLLGAFGCASSPVATQETAEVRPETGSTDTAAAAQAEAGGFGLGQIFKRATEEPGAEGPAALAVEPGEYDNLWDRIRAGFKLPRMEGPVVESHERWFINNPDYMERMLQRANLYLFHIVEEVEKRGLPLEIALLPAIESAYQPRAYSHARASGLWQFIPSTGKLYGLKSDWWYDGRRDVQASTRAAMDYLEKLNKDFDGDWYLSLAAYNAGEGRVMRAMAKNRAAGLSTAYQDLRLPRETQHYVPKLMAVVNIIADPERYGLELREIPNSPYFVQVDVGSQIDLGVVAKLAKLEVDDLYNINPGYNRWATSPNGPHHLLVPVSVKEALLQGLNELPEEERVQWARHAVKRGDTLSEISRNFGVSVAAIKEANGLRSSRLRIGQDLLIPVSGRKLLVQENRATKQAKQSAGKVKVVHRVKAGETLYSIAKRYRVYIKDIARWNTMSSRDILRAGEKLIIWTTGRRTSALPGDNAEAA